ncbi:uncharacterized protein METZ01_LOCUS49919 [marine metagenome]|uniref:Uncharacterized protein n=1 Tax=marine metagenome TaxID=408172 RepID=A0A381RYX5_9ZZZZ
MVKGLKKYPATSYSPTLVSRAVPSAQWGLTAEFGMGSGVSPTLLSPENFGNWAKNIIKNDNLVKPFG